MGFTNSKITWTTTVRLVKAKVTEQEWRSVNSTQLKAIQMINQDFKTMKTRWMMTGPFKSRTKPALAKLEDVHIEPPAKDEEEQQEPVSRSFVCSLMEPPNGRPTYIIDLRPEDSKNPL